MRAKLVFPITYRNVILFISNICFLYISTRELKKNTRKAIFVLSDWTEQHLMVKQCYKSLERLLFTFSPFILFQSFVWPKHWKIQREMVLNKHLFSTILILALCIQIAVQNVYPCWKPFISIQGLKNLMQKSRAWLSLPVLENSTSFSYFFHTQIRKNPISKDCQNPNLKTNLKIETWSNSFLNYNKSCQKRCILAKFW